MAFEFDVVEEVDAGQPTESGGETRVGKKAPGNLGDVECGWRGGSFEGGGGKTEGGGVAAIRKSGLDLSSLSLRGRDII